MNINFSKTHGRLRALHGVNNGPICFGGLTNLTEYHRALNIPSTRLHDCGWPHPVVVDVPAIFPVFSADEQDPASYHFEATDDYLASLVPLTKRVIYRLGTSIEHTARRYHTHPPRDFAKWTRICVGMIRHFNEGWAGGHHFGIKDFEIWNEPDLGERMWSGTREQYFELYAQAARAIKAHDPSLRVGGPGLAFAAGEFAVAFLDFVRAQRLPLDFFSWHLYASEPVAEKRLALQVRAMLDERGFQNSQSLLTEWNCFVGDWLRLHEPAHNRECFTRSRGPEGAALVASALILLQDAAVDEANLYSGDTQWWGAFDEFGAPHKVYYGLLAFARLMETPLRAAATGGDETTGLTVAAGLAEDRRSAQVLVSNHRDGRSSYALEMAGLPFKQGSAEIFLLDGKYDLQSVRTQDFSGAAITLQQELPAPSVALIRLREK